MKNIGKRLAVAALATTFVCGSAMASKTDLWALGQDDFGSRLTKSERNHLLNPSDVLNQGNYAQLELYGERWSGFDLASTGYHAGSAQPGDTTVLGLSVGYKISDTMAVAIDHGAHPANNTTVLNGVYTLAKAGAEAQGQDEATAAAAGVTAANQVLTENLQFNPKRTTISFGMDFSGMKTGLGFYTQSSTENGTAKVMGVKLGLAGDGWSFDWNQGLGTEYVVGTAANTSFPIGSSLKGKSGFTAGFTYDIMGMTLEGVYAPGKAEIEVLAADNGAVKNKYEIDGQTMSLNARKVWGDVSTIVGVEYYTKKFSQTSAATASTDQGVMEDKTELSIPLLMTYSTKVSDALTLTGTLGWTWTDKKDIDDAGAVGSDANDREIGGTDDTKILRLASHWSLGDVQVDAGFGYTERTASMNTRSSETELRGSLTYNF